MASMVEKQAWLAMTLIKGRDDEIINLSLKNKYKRVRWTHTYTLVLNHLDRLWLVVEDMLGSQNKRGTLHKHWPMLPGLM